MSEEELRLLFEARSAMLAHGQILATLLSEVAMMTPDPKGFLARLRNDEEDLAVGSLGDPKTSQGLHRELFEQRDRELQSVYDQARLTLKLKKLLLGASLRGE